MGRALRIAVATALGVAATAYWFVVRPWHRRWGATRGEARERLPGDDLVPRPADEITRAVTVEAPAEAVWPWLTQLGQDRGSLLGAVVPGTPVGASASARDRPPLEVGDTVPLVPERLPVDSSVATPEVAILDDERALVLRSSSDRPAVSWAFVLEPDEAGRTRLIARTRARRPDSIPNRAGARLLEPVHFAVERKLLLDLKQRAERDRREAAPSEPEIGPAI